MNPLIQISQGKTSDSSKSIWAKASASGSASKSEFDILLSMLAGIGGSATASKGKAASGGSSDAKGKASADQKKTDTLSSMEERLLEIISSGRTPAKQKGNSGSKSEKVSAYAAAGTPVVAADQQTRTAGKKSSSSSAAPPTAEGDKAAVNPALEREISAYLETAANDAGSGEDPSKASDATKAQAANESKNVRTAADNHASDKELLKLISASKDGNVDARVLKELDALVAKSNAGDGSSAKGVSSSKTQATAESAAHTSVSNLTGTIKATKQDLGSTIVADLKSGSGSSGSKAGSINSAEIGGAASKVKSLGVKETNVDQSNSAVVSQAPSANQAPTGTQGKTGPDQAVANQTVQAQQVRLDQGNRDTANSGGNQSDTSKFASAQAFTAPASSNAAGVSFGQALSAAPQNVANPTTINLQQLAQGIVKQVSLMTLQGKKIVNMKLEPESLGSVSLQVVSDGSKISAQFNVRTADAKMFLESSVPQMKQMLETNGITLSHLSVNLSGGEPQSGNHQYRYKQRKQSVKYFSDPSESVVPVGSPEMSRSFGYNTMEMQV